MKVILISNVENLGLSGQEKEVKDGYAKNFLIAKGLAVYPSDPKAKEIHQVKEKKTREQKEKKNDIIKVAQDIDGKKIVFIAKADEKGNLFGSIGPKKIGEKLGIDTGLISETYKKTGTYDLEIKFDPQNIAKVRIVIKKEK